MPSYQIAYSVGMMRTAVVSTLLGYIVLASGQSFHKIHGEENLPFGIPQEQVFKHAKGIKLGPETKNNPKFLEEKIFPVEYWNPPNRDVAELYFNGKAVASLNDGLFKTKGFSDTDLIMMNRWNGLDSSSNLWEADMILTAKQRSLYSNHGKVFDNTMSLMPNFSEPWPGGKVEYFYENEMPSELSNDLQMAFFIWEKAIGCIKFEIPDEVANFSTDSSRDEETEYMDDVSPEYVVDDMETNTEPATLSKPKSALHIPLSPDSLMSDDVMSSNSPRFVGTSHLLRVTVGRGCYATVGWRPWSRLVISEHCSLGVLVHLLGHVLGLPHEHSRPDRVFHVHLHAQNIHTRDFMFLNVANGSDTCSSQSNWGWYDLHSVMHLDAYGLSANNLSAISAQNFPETAHVGISWHQPSYTDILRLRRPEAYACPAPEVSEKCDAATVAECTPPGHLSGSCACVQPTECTARVAPRDGWSADLRVGKFQTDGSDVEQMAAPTARHGRPAAWLFRAGDTCGRVRLTISVRMEQAARVAAATVGCAALRVEILDKDVLDSGRNTSGVICLSDFARWQPQHQRSWHAEKVVVSSSHQLRVLIKSYLVGDTPLGRVVASLTAKTERVVDKYCHCHLFKVAKKATTSQSSYITVNE